MATMFISPRINVGEKAAGGSLTIYADGTMQTLQELWLYADLKLDAEGRGRLSNPVPVDNWGIDSSPVFFEDNANAYYVVKDAKGAVIRQGYVMPCSWQGGGSPPDAGKWNGMEGDWHWGYEVVEGTLALEEHNIVKRPLYLNLPGGNDIRNGAAADKSGGVIVWAVPGSGTGDGVITFASKESGTIWKAREEYIKSSYLISRQKDVAWLESNYKGQYSIELDQAFASNSPGGDNVHFSGKVRLSKAIQDTASGTMYCIHLLPGNLEILVPNAITMTGANTIPKTVFRVSGGSFRASGITGSNGAVFVHGSIDSLLFDQTNANLNGLRIGRVVSDNTHTFTAQSFNQYTQIGEIDYSVLQNLKLREYPKIEKLAVDIANASLDLEGSEGIAFKVKAYGAAGNGILSLTDSGFNGQPKAYRIEPSHRLRYDNTFYAANAEFYSLATPHESIGKNNLHAIGSECKGDLVLNDFASGKLKLDSRSVNADGWIGDGDYPIIYASAANSIKNCEVRFAQEDDIFGDGMHHYIGELSGCKLKAGRWNFNTAQYAQGTGVHGKLTSVLHNCKITECEVWLGCQKLALANCKMSDCHVQGRQSFAGGNPDNSFQWSSHLAMGDGTSVENSSFESCIAMLWFPAPKKEIRNVKFNCNKAVAPNTFIDLGGYGSNGSSNWQAGEPLIMEGIEFVGNHADESDNAFMVLCKNYSENYPFIKGHIEIEGYYDYSMTAGQPVAGRVFPMEGKNITQGVQWTGSEGSEFISDLCLYIYGDPLKYANTPNGGTAHFVTVDNKKEIVRTQLPQSQYPSHEISVAEGYSPDDDDIWHGVGTSSSATATFGSLPHDSVLGSYGSNGFRNPDFDEAAAIALGYADKAAMYAALGDRDKQNPLGDVIIISENSIGFIPKYFNSHENFDASGHIGWMIVRTQTTGETQYVNDHGIAKTNYAYYSSEMGVNIANCLLCCLCDVKMYRIRE